MPGNSIHTVTNQLLPEAGTVSQEMRNVILNRYFDDCGASKTTDVWNRMIWILQIKNLNYAHLEYNLYFPS